MSGEREPDAQDVERGKRPSVLREAAGYERRLDLGAIAGIGPVEVSRIESGKHRFTEDTPFDSTSKSQSIAESFWNAPLPHEPMSAR